MKKVFLVDDEPLVTEVLESLVDWNSYGMGICGSANDGISARKDILEKRPDLVITDIRMPGMNGLDLIESVQKELPDTLFVIISGYNDFNYIRAALRLNVVDYLDKPVTVEKIQSMLQEVKGIFEKNQSTSEKEENPENFSAEAFEKNGNVPQEKLVFRDQIGFLLRTGEWEKAKNSVEEVLEQLTVLRPSPDVAKHICLEMIYLSTAICSETGKEYTEDGTIFLPHVQIRSMTQIKEVQEWTKKTLFQIVCWLQNRREQVEHKDIMKAKRYIDEHYGEAITLRMLADMCYMNQNYFSAVFRDNVGMTYVKYLNAVRMEHAKKMLQEGKKIKVVSEKCGFQNTRYFSEKFKSYTGVTPEQYRLGGNG